MPLPHLPARFRPSTLAVCLHGALCLALLPSSGFAQAPAATDAGARAYRIVAGPLDDALNRFARQAGITLSFTPQQVDGLRSRGLEGSFSVQTGLTRLLDGSGYVARLQAPGHYVLQTREPLVGTAAPHAASAAPPPAAEVTLPTTTVTAARDRRQEVYDTPGSVAVITREEIDRLPPRNTADLLTDVPGVYTSQSRMDPGISVNIRGLQDFGRVNVMIDGTRQNYQQSGHGSNGSVYLDPELLGGADIAKGPTSTVGGAGMIAGLVNFRTLEVADLLQDGQTLGGRVNTTTGSNAYDFAGSAALGLKAGEDFDGVMVLSRKKVGAFEKGQRGSVREGLDAVVHGISQLTDQDQTSALLKGTWRFAPGHMAKLSYIGLDAKFGEKAQSASAGGLTNHVRTDTLLANYNWNPADSKLIDLKTSLYYTRTRNEAFRHAGGQLDDNAYQLRYQTSTVGGTLENTARLALAKTTDAVLKTGGEFFHDWTSPQAQALSIGADAGTTALYTGSTPEGKRTVASLFGEATLLHDSWLEVTGGLRYDWYGLQGDGRMRIGSISNPAGVRPSTTALYTRFQTDRHGGSIAPRLSVAVKPIEQLQFFANIGRGMRPPAITESLQWGQHVGSLFPYYPNPDLRAEYSRNTELGVNAVFKGLLTERDALRVKAAWFDSKVKNYVTLGRIMAPNDTAGGGLLGPYAYVNLDDPFRSKGLELQADYDTGRVFGSLSYTHMMVKTGKGGYDPFPLGSMMGFPSNTLGTPGDANIWYTLPPRKNLSVSAGVRLLDDKLTLGGRMRFQSPTATTSVWTVQGDAYNQKAWHLYDLWASYALNRHTTLRLAINNLMDKNYAEMQGGGYFVGPGRTAMVTLSLKF